MNKRKQLWKKVLLKPSCKFSVEIWSPLSRLASFNWVQNDVSTSFISEKNLWIHDKLDVPEYALGYQFSLLHPPFSQSTALNLIKIVQVPFLGKLPYIRFLTNPLHPLNVTFFSDPLKYQNCLYLTPSHLLKVSKFLVKISQFNFLVMTDKIIFYDK